MTAWTAAGRAKWRKRIDERVQRGRDTDNRVAEAMAEAWIAISVCALARQIRMSEGAVRASIARITKGLGPQAV